jgi:apolipoprotein N-acyltransferase
VKLRLALPWARRQGPGARPGAGLGAGSGPESGAGPGTWSRLGLALLSGLILALAFPPVGARWAVLAALVPLLLAAFPPREIGPAGPKGRPLGFRQRFLLGFVCGVVFFAVLLDWLLLLPGEEMTVPWLMAPALLFLSSYLALFVAAATALAGLADDRAGIPAPVAFPVTWVVFEQLRGCGVLGFPWGWAGYAFAPHPAALQIAAWTGIEGITLWVLCVNAAFFAAARAWLEGRPRAALVCAGGAVAIAVAVPLFGGIVLARAPRDTVSAVDGGSYTAISRDRNPESDTTITRERNPGSPEEIGPLAIALLQANTPREIKWKHGYEGIVVDDLLARTRSAAAAGADVVIWPETAAPLMILWDPELAGRVRDTVAEARAWTLVGTLDAVLRGGGDFDAYNAAMLYDPTGKLRQRYYKMKLVPFSEAMPFSGKIPWMNALNFGQSDFRAGEEQTVLHAGKHPFAVLICFESIFPELSRERVRRGARYLVNITNDFWFGRSAGPTQHAEMSIVRAVENRTPLARCANTGISFFVDPWGRVTQRTGLFVEARPLAWVRSGTGGSFYTRHGEFLLWALRASFLLMMGMAAWNGWRSRRRKPAGEETP